MNDGKVLISNNTNYLVAVFDSRSSTRLIAGLSLGRTVFVCLILALGSMLFIKDASDVIIGPVLIMIEKIRRIAANPVEAASKEDKEALDKELQEEQAKLAVDSSSRIKACLKVITSECIIGGGD